MLKKEKSVRREVKRSPQRKTEGKSLRRKGYPHWCHSLVRASAGTLKGLRFQLGCMQGQPIGVSLTSRILSLFLPCSCSLSLFLSPPPSLPPSLKNQWQKISLGEHRRQRRRKRRRERRRKRRRRRNRKRRRRRRRRKEKEKKGEENEKRERGDGEGGGRGKGGGGSKRRSRKRRRRKKKEEKEREEHEEEVMEKKIGRRRN